MKFYIFSTLISLFSFFNEENFSENNTTLTVDLLDMRPRLGGSIFIMLVDENDKPVTSLVRPISENNTRFVFSNLANKRYAVRAYHDQNNNSQLDKGVFGQPVEGWGVSNDVRGFMSAPPFQKMLVNVASGSNTAIKIRITY
jgi:uncharacterized protein (DUF2141 family)